jgi:hypothetical protein
MSGPWDYSLIAVPVEPDALNAIMHVYDGTYMISLQLKFSCFF